MQLTTSEQSTPGTGRGVAASGSWLALVAAVMLVPTGIAALVPIQIPLPAYPAVHAVMETFAVVVAALIFAVGWHTAVPARAPRLTLLSVGFLAVALLDLAHLLSYQGMPVFFTPNNPSKAIYFWLAARFTAAIALLGFAATSSAMPGRRRWLITAMVWVALLVLVVLRAEAELPTVFAVGSGLTATKVGAEGVLVAMYVAAVPLLARRSAEGSPVRRDLLAVAAVALAASEVPFFLYGAVTDGFNLVGHLEKILAYALLYRAVVLQAVRDPYVQLEESHAALSASETRLREITGRVTDVLFLSDGPTDALLFVSAAYDRVWMRSRTDIIASPSRFLEYVHPDDRPGLLAEWVGRTERELTLEYRILRPDGEVRSIHARTAPVRDEAGRPVRVVGVARDVTDERAMHARMANAERMETVARLAAGVAHDFNNLLTVILTSTSFAAEALKDGPEGVREDIAAIDDAARRAERLVRQLLSFARGEALTRRIVDVGEAAGGLTELLGRMLGSAIQVSTEVEAGAHPVLCDPTHIEQLVVNCAVNARDAMPDGGTVRLVVRTATASEVEACQLRGAPSEYVLLRIVDTGVGMTEEVRRRALEPFFSTKEVGKGSGLGLATSFGIVRGLHGGMMLKSAPGRGTQVDIVLPRAPTPRAPSVVGAGLGRTLLVVDDDAPVRRSIVRTLEAGGYTVVEAADGEEARRLAATLRQLALVVTDVTMPEMDGVALAAVLRVERPALPVLFVTGYTERQVPQPCLAKPFEAAALLQAVAAALGTG